MSQRPFRKQFSAVQVDTGWCCTARRKEMCTKHKDSSIYILALWIIQNRNVTEINTVQTCSFYFFKPCGGGLEICKCIVLSRYDSLFGLKRSLYSQVTVDISAPELVSCTCTKKHLWVIAPQGFKLHPPPHSCPLHLYSKAYGDADRVEAKNVSPLFTCL